MTTDEIKEALTHKEEICWKNKYNRVQYDLFNEIMVVNIINGNAALFTLDMAKDCFILQKN